jgi:hypothetical protein
MAEKKISGVAVIGLGIMGPDIALGFALGGAAPRAMIYAGRAWTAPVAGWIRT